MNVDNIRKLRRKFVIISIVSIFVVMALVGTAVNVASYTFVTGSIRKTLNTIIGEEGIPNQAAPGDLAWTDMFSPAYTHNHFIVVRYDAEGTPLFQNGNVEDEEELATMQDYVEGAYYHRASFGRQGRYFYLRRQMADGTTAVALLDCAIEIWSIFRIMILTIAISLAALLITFLVVWHFSERAVRPEIENNRRQKEFITNASHELKTPLAVIRANTELIEMTAGESEWTQSTLSQVERVEGLINNLVMIARAQKQADQDATAVVDVSHCVSQTVDTYEALARQEGHELTRHVQDGVCMMADEGKLRQLATVLLDNAMKYCDEGGAVDVALTSDKKSVTLIVSNTYSEGEGVDYDKFFDRFYRHDESHNIDRGGYGIGLSIADSICRAYHGTIHAEWRDGVIRFVCCLMRRGYYC